MQFGYKYDIIYMIAAVFICYKNLRAYQDIIGREYSSSRGKRFRDSFRIDIQHIFRELKQ